VANCLLVRKPDEKLQANSPTGNHKIDSAAQGFNYWLNLEVAGGEKARMQLSSCHQVWTNPGAACILVVLEGTDFLTFVPLRLLHLADHRHLMPTWPNSQ